jgi:hypothetical protein
MAEVLIQFDSPVLEAAGGRYFSRVCGRQGGDGMWEGWIEFVPLDGGSVVRTGTESRQPDRDALQYWASGLTAVYLEGALDRAAGRSLPDLRPPTTDARPAYDAPAPREEVAPAPRRPVPPPATVLDPFQVYAQGEDVLRAELGALGEAHLRNIIRRHSLVSDTEVDLQVMRRGALAELIVGAVRRRTG